MSHFEASYRKLHRSGQLRGKVEEALQRLQSCDLCPHCCRTNRLVDSAGLCGCGRKAVVYSYGPHHGEERPLVGRHGSGTIFFGWCNLKCVFCQNWEISQLGEGREVSAEQLAQMMMSLEQQGCANINLVSPSHHVAQILKALLIAVDAGLQVPLVYNSGGYDSLETLALLDGVIDIYLPDMKFADTLLAEKYLRVKNYPEVNRAAVKEMHRQVGDLQLNQAGTAQRGLLVRHLILPENLAGSEQALKFIASEISTATYLNLMDQYRPCYQADRYPPLDSRPSRSDIEAVRAIAKRLGLLRLDRP